MRKMVTGDARRIIELPDDAVTLSQPNEVGNQDISHLKKIKAGAAQGWECPKCGTILAPWMPTCNCNRGAIVVPNPMPYSTGTSPNHRRTEIASGEQKQ
jgi:hypothetical protein